MAGGRERVIACKQAYHVCLLLPGISSYGAPPGFVPWIPSGTTAHGLRPIAADIHAIACKQAYHVCLLLPGSWPSRILYPILKINQ